VEANLTQQPQPFFIFTSFTIKPDFSYNADILCPILFWLYQLRTLNCYGYNLSELRMTWNIDAKMWVL
ncbi:MAG: hypothetical protein WAZ30_03130, partial [Syntrophorhabdus sp.]